MLNDARGRRGGGVHERGTALVEAVVALSLVTVLIVVMTVAAGESRRTSSLSDAIGNLKQLHWAGGVYTADNNERIWAFSWRAGAESPSKFPDLQAAATDWEAASNQAVDIIRRRADPAFPKLSWLPHLGYSHLVLADHLDLPLPLRWAVSSVDSQRVAWQQWPNHPIPLPSDPTLVRLVYSSTYELGPAFFSRDMRGPSNTTLYQNNSHSQFTFGTFPPGDRHITEVRYPSRKAMMWDQQQRHFGTNVMFFAYEDARIPVLTADGAVSVRATAMSNRGFYPNIPSNVLPPRFFYSPASWEPPVPAGQGTLVTGHYRWTRGGLRGRDFGEREICTGQISECDP